MPSDDALNELSAILADWYELLEWVADAPDDDIDACMERAMAQAETSGGLDYWLVRGLLGMVVAVQIASPEGKRELLDMLRPQLTVGDHDAGLGGI